MTSQINKPRIQKLSPLLINQLSAGEVVTRPASVVKEVLENAIDAGSSKIEIRITQGGMGVIEISDNGLGIHPDDMQMAVTRHATSKVANVENLYGIETLGFRGEALASIASVSRFSLTSSHDDSGVGRCLSVAGVIEGQANIIPCVCQQGTTVTVKDLYFNVPARRGNLKNISTEYAHIESVVRQIALAYADIDLILYHEGKKRLTLTAQVDKSSQAQLYRLQQALSVTLPSLAYPLAVDLSILLTASEANSSNSNHKLIIQPKIDGWLWIDDVLQANNELPKLIYINGRLVKNISISQQIRQAINSLSIPSQAVGYALFFVLPHEWCNLNVHPSKQRINIHALTNINAHLYQAIRALLQPHLESFNQLQSEIFNQKNEQIAPQLEEIQRKKAESDTANNVESTDLPSTQTDIHDKNLSIKYFTHSKIHHTRVNHQATLSVNSPSEVYQVDRCYPKKDELVIIDDINQAMHLLQQQKHTKMLHQLIKEAKHTWLQLENFFQDAEVSIDKNIVTMWLPLPQSPNTKNDNLITVLLFHKENLAIASSHFSIMNQP